MFEGVRKIPVDELALGMYVCELDRPWVDTPFVFQGFFLESRGQIDELCKHCEFVYVDLLRTRERVAAPLLQSLARSGSRKSAPAGGAAGRFVNGEWQRPAQDPYPVQTEVQEEIGPARAAREQTEDALRSIIADVRNGRKPGLARARAAVGGLVDTVVRNPNALVWLTRLKDIDSYSYAHSIDVCAYMLAFGRHLGLPTDELRTVGLGGLLLDIGKVRLRPELVQKLGVLTEDEFREMQDHVTYAVTILREIGNVPEKVILMTQQHHERHDGSGYPNGLKGRAIGFYGRMASISDTFDAITSQRAYSSALSSHQALRKLYEWRDTLFHGGLVEQFIECLGVYPVGSVVELNTGQVAIVMSQNRFRQLKPRLVLVLDPEKKPYGTMDILDLIDDPADADERAIEIERAVEPGMYGIDPRDYYL